MQKAANGFSAAGSSSKMLQSSEFCQSFPPLIDSQCRILILGSMPGVASLTTRQYYAHPRNRFWPLMTKILTGSDAVPSAYADRLQMLLTHHIALWDVLADCQRAGSLDTAIKNEEANDLAGLLKKYPQIQRICFNGSKAFNSFKKQQKELLKRTDIAFYPMPSTSPANARWRLPELIETWGKVL